VVRPLDITDLLENPFSDVRLERLFGHQIDVHPQQLRKALFKAHESDETDWPLEFDKDIDFAPRTLLAAHHRAKNTDLHNAEFGPQLLLVLSDDQAYVVD
jgi:hypothetical protein